jgi:hypothetical protein
MKTKIKLMPKVRSLAELRNLAETDERYKKLMIVSASNLGQPNANEQVAYESLENCVMETDEQGVVDEINFCRDLV